MAVETPAARIRTFNVGDRCAVTLNLRRLDTTFIVVTVRSNRAVQVVGLDRVGDDRRDPFLGHLGGTPARRAASTSTEGSSRSRRLGSGVVAIARS